MPRRKSQLSPHTSMVRRAKRRRNEESYAENSNRLLSQRKYASQVLARECSVDRTQRLAAQNVRTSQLRNQETATKRETRLAAQNVRTSQIRSQEIDTERSTRLAAQNVRTSQLRNQETDTERLTRLTAQSIRTSQTRGQETDTERSMRLTAQSVRTSQTRGQETDTERSTRLTAQSVRTSQTRGQETDTERSTRLTAQSIRTSQIRSQETDTERSTRLTAQSVRTSQTRGQETDTERSTRLTAQSVRTSQTRGQETDTERSTRLTAQSIRTSQIRSQETDTERSTRLTAQSVRTSQTRGQETDTERSTRLTAQSIRTSQIRSQETDTERSTRLTAQSVRTSQTRGQETDTERSTRLAAQSIRTSQIRGQETDTERSTRLAAQSVRTSQLRSQETDTERLTRLAAQNMRTSEIRNRESSAERLRRLSTQSLRSRSYVSNRNLANNNNRIAFNYDSNTDYAQHRAIQIGGMNKVCSKCFAEKWIDEANGMCCAAGKVILPDVQEPPQPIKDLLTGNHELSAHFLKNVRRYNSLFQMTSFGAKEIREGNFMPSFKIEGQIYHLIGSLLPSSGQSPQFLQIYFISDADQLSLRTNIAPTLKIDLINVLQSILNNHNLYVRSFKYNLEQRSSENLKLIIHADRPIQNQHQGRYNAPTVNEVAVLLVDEDKGPRDIVLQSRDGQLKRVSELHRAYDPLQYPLMFIKGEDGYYLTISQQGSARNKTVSCMQFYAYRLMTRANCFNALHYYKDLFSQYCVDMMAKMISERLNFISRNQQKLRADEYIHLRDALNQDANLNAANIGQKVILPSSFTGSPRYMHEKTQDAMTYVRNYGRPDLFITFTCNPEWKEIKQELSPGQRSYDRHDIIARVFHLKMKKLVKFITKDEIFGTVKCHMLSVEWQKRGLPHCHILLWLDRKIRPDEIDLIIVAELPDKNNDSALFDIVTKNMIHGPCGEGNTTSPCLKNGICSKKYPRRFVSDTQTGEDGYPVYRRRDTNDGGQVANLNIRGRTITIDNRWVVPYSPILCRSFNAHINVEYCHSVQAIKYICKYINKGSDQASFSVKNVHDEVEKYLNGRYISTSEAVWRLLEFPIHERSPTVVHLAVHLENGQRVYFSSETMRQVVDNPQKTTLTAFFALCRSDVFAKTLLYHEVPHYYTWANNTFSRRKRGHDVVGYPGIKKEAALGRVYSVHPSQSECFHLRVLLHHVRGPTSFKDLKTVDGIVKESYQAACRDRGLLENDDHWEKALREASISECALKLRELFIVILLFCQPSHPAKLWQDFKDDLCEDMRHRIRQQNQDFNLPFNDNIYNQGLILIENKLIQQNDKRLIDFGLPSPTRSHYDAIDTIFTNTMYDSSELSVYVNVNIAKLVADQRHAYNNIIESVENNKGKIFFLDAPGGTGKTFLANLILAKVRLSGKIALAVASSGIAATLLNDGKTAHSTFKLPLNVSLEQQSVCSIRKNGPLGKLLQDTSLIIWDECTMSNKAHVEAVNRTLIDLRNTNAVMGGVTFVFAGDFRQTLPVIAKGTRADVIKACLKSSVLWGSIQTLNLRTNMRAQLSANNDDDFPRNLLNLGEGKFPTLIINSTDIKLNNKFGRIVYSLEHLIDAIYPDITHILQRSYHWLCSRAIVTPKNDSVNEINDFILQKVPGQIKIYKSIDTVTNVEDTVHYPQEFLNSLNPSGLPPFNLMLKVGVPIMLLRNLSPPNMCNGTRFLVKDLRDNIIIATILTGPAAGQLAHIPRIPMIPTDLPIPFRRLQFPVKVSFALTINKSQGQTFSLVGIDLRKECFTHGQLYVGLSRVGSPQNQYILLPDNNITSNIVYKEALV